MFRVNGSLEITSDVMIQVQIRSLDCGWWPQESAVIVLSHDNLRGLELVANTLLP